MLWLTVYMLSEVYYLYDQTPKRPWIISFKLVLYYYVGNKNEEQESNHFFEYKYLIHWAELPFSC